MRLFDTLRVRKEAFRSAEPGKVKMFVCGPTVQDYIHVGHARTYLFYDMLARYLSYLGYEVEFVVNITDIDEGIVKGAESAGTSVGRFASKYGQAFMSDMEALRIGSVTAYDKVSERVPEMISQVEGLVAKGIGYRVGGSVYFSVDRFPRFGRLSHQTRYELSLRPLEISESKRNQTDFSLWRTGGSGEQKWDSPWGRGTPGWHVQDTAVSYARFGAQYDIHGGARELVYPHHEAEIAQMEALTGLKPMVRYWVHTGLLTQHREKMAKSKGNALHARDALEDFGPDAMRLCFLSMHHLKDAEFSERALREWRDIHLGLRERLRLVEPADGKRESPETERFLAMMNDDLQAGQAIKVLRAAVRDLGRDRGKAARMRGLARAASSILGVALLEDGA